MLETEEILPDTEAGAEPENGKNRRTFSCQCQETVSVSEIFTPMKVFDNFKA